MKAYLIDPEARKITTIEHDDSINDLKELIQAPMFDVVRINAFGDGIYVDDEGLYREPQHFFAYEGVVHPLAGNGVVLGVDDQGNSITPLGVSSYTLNDNVKWLTPAQAYVMARKADAEMMRRIAEAEQKDPETQNFHVSTADIMDGKIYTDGPSGDNDENKLPERPRTPVEDL